MWTWIAYVVIALVAGYALSQSKKPATTQEPGKVDLPTAEEGKALYVLFGTRDIRDPNIVWYGDISAQPVKKKGGKK